MFQLISTLRIYFKTLSGFGFLVCFFFSLLYSFPKTTAVQGGKGREMMRFHVCKQIHTFQTWVGSLSHPSIAALWRQNPPCSHILKVLSVSGASAASGLRSGSPPPRPGSSSHRGALKKKIIIDNCSSRRMWA